MVRSNVVGGLSAAFFTLPYAVAYGVVAVFPLGPDAISLGILLGLVSGVVAGLVGPVVGSKAVLIGTVRAPSALLYASLLQILISYPQFQGDNALETFQKCLPILSIFTCLSGVAVVLLNRFALVGMVSKMPTPVVKGYVLASTLLSMYKQLPLLIGIAGTYLVLQGYWLVVICSIITGLAYAWCRNKYPSSPGSVFALIVGTVMIGIFNQAGWLGESAFQLGMIESVAVLLPNVDRWQVILNVDTIAILLQALPILLALVFFISLETHIVVAHVEPLSHVRPELHRDLNAAGWSNIACGLVGCLPSGYYITGASASLAAGANNRQSEWFYALFLALILLTSPFVLSYLATPILGAVVIAASILTMDRWVFNTVKESFAQKEWTQRLPVLVSALVSALVVITAIVADFQAAILMGVTLAVALFLHQQSNNLIKSISSLKERRSTKMRNHLQSDLLGKHGDQSMILTLQGSLFFGNYTELKKIVFSLAHNKSGLVIDCSSLLDVDITGLECLKLIVELRARDHKRTWVCGLNRPSNAQDLLKTHSTLQSVVVASCLADQQFQFLMTDDALQLMEEHLLALLNQKSLISNEIDTDNLEKTDLFFNMSDSQIKLVMRFAKMLQFEPGQTLFKKGDSGDGFYALIEGRVAVMARAIDGRHRIASYAPGVVFGEMAVIDKQPRMADAVVEEKSLLLHLSSTAIDELQQKYPEIAQFIHLNIARVLSSRLRISMRELQTYRY